MDLIKATEKFFSAMEACDSKWLQENLTDDFSFNGHYPPFTKDAFIKGQQGIISSFTGWHYELKNIEAMVGRVSGYCSINGLHTHALQLPDLTIVPFEASNKKVKTGFQKFIIQFEQNKIKSLWTEMGKGMGMSHVLEQLGIYLERFHS